MHSMNTDLNTGSLPGLEGPGAGCVQPACSGVLTRRRCITTVLSRAGGVLLAGACRPAAQAPGEGAPAPQALDRNQRDHLVWFIWSSNTGARGEAYAMMTRRFNEQFPNVTVEQISGGGDLKGVMDKLITMIASDSRLDIVGVTPDLVPMYAEQMNVLANLRPFLKVDPSLKESDHVEGIVEYHVWKGKLYALPVGVVTNHACLNLDVLQENGIAPPGPDWTIDQALDIARRTTVRRTSDEDSTWGFYHWWQGVPRFVYSWIRGNGGEPLVPPDEPTKSQWSTDAATRDTIQWLVDLAQKQGVMPVNPIGGVWGAFRQGRGVISIMETNNLYQNPPAEGAASFRWDVQHLPLMKRGRYYPSWAFSYGLSQVSKNPPLAWEFLKHVVGPEGQTAWFQLARFAPSIKAVLNGAYLQDPNPPQSKKVIVESLVAAKPMPKSVAWLDITNITAEVLTDVRLGKRPVNEGLAEIDQRITLALQKR
jgi:multiple sugar transport system substrate-binding protein